MLTGRRTAAAVTATAVGLATLAIGVATAPGAGAVSTVVQRVVIGHSVQGRDIVAYRLGDPTSSRKAVVIGQIHGDERAGVSVANTLIDRPVGIIGVDLWVVPTMNPDGYAAHTRQNAHHVDLNRNWPDNWAPLSGEFYSGTGPMSEPETRTMYNFLARINPSYVVVMHQPLDGVDGIVRKSHDGQFAARLSHYLGIPLSADSPGRGGFSCWSACHGSMGDWAPRHMVGDYATLEFPAHPSASYLTSRAPTSIVAALRSHFVPLSWRNPRGYVNTVTANGPNVAIRGWTYDPDRTTSHVLVRVFDGTRFVAAKRVASGYAALPRTSVNRIGVPGNHGYVLRFTAARGHHTYCVVTYNLAAGTGYTQSCHALTVT